MANVNNSLKPHAGRDHLEKVLASFDAGVPAAFAHAMKSFLTALDYEDPILMRARLFEVRDGLADAVNEAVEKRLRLPELAAEMCHAVLEDIEGHPFDSAEELEQIRRDMETNLDRFSQALTDLRDEVVRVFVAHGLEVPNAAQLQASIEKLQALKEEVFAGWPRVGQELPPVDRRMVEASRAAIDRGEGERVEELIRRLGGGDRAE
jgi:hypothetical protein